VAVTWQLELVDGYESECDGGRLLLTLDFPHGDKLDDVACRDPPGRALQSLTVVSIQDLQWRIVKKTEKKIIEQ
jgi:hypothetical protein